MRPGSPSTTRPTLAVLAFLALAAPASAQCAEWDARFSPVGADGEVNAMVVFDDGTGAALYLGGRFTSAGDQASAHVAKWNGTTWTKLALGLGPDAPSSGTEAKALAVFDDGSGSALFVGGTFTSAGGVSTTGVAKWDGAAWSSPGGGTNATVHALSVFDDGSGAALYAAGTFTTAGGISASRIARWNGTAWTAVGSGVNGTAYALGVFDGGSGPALCVGGAFTTAGATSAAGIARWNATGWSALGSGVNSSVRALAVFDDGAGPALYAGGNFTVAGGIGAVRVARWRDASGWSALSGDVNGQVSALFAFDDGAGPALFAGGAFTTTGGTTTNRVARWNGTAWSAVLAGMDKNVNALAAFDDGSGPALYAGGAFALASGAAASRIARWNGVTWNGQGLGSGVDGVVLALADYGNFAGTQLYAGGSFASVGGVPSTGIARWDGTAWGSTGSGLGRDGSVPNPAVRALAVHDDGSGSALYAGGIFDSIDDVPAANIAKWNTSSWSQVGLGLGPSAGVNALATYDDGSGSALFAAGAFLDAGGVGANYIAKWNGTSWSALSSAPSGPVNALAVFNDGTGSALYAGGAFADAGGTTVRFVAKWKGSTWSALQSGLSGAVQALEVLDYGAGPALYAAGTFTSTAFGALSVGCIARWDGANWSSLAGGMSGGVAAPTSVRAIAVYDDGRGRALHAGGNFTTAGGVSASSIARWDGAGWSALDGGVTGLAPTVHALATYQDGADEALDLFAGGSFALAGGAPSFGFAELHGCPTGTPYCFGDGTDPVQTAACPCGLFGAPGHGCANSNPMLRGAHLYATGTTSPNTVVLTCENIVNNAISTFVRSSTKNTSGFLFGDGVCCVDPPLLRFAQQTSGQGGNAVFKVTVPAPTEPPGRTRHYFVHYRNTVATHCTPALFNASNGYTIQW